MTWVNEYLRDWPGVGQVFRLERQRTTGGKTTVEVVYGLTSLTPAEASAEQLLSFSRSHWGIENGLHWVRDETLGEDRCRVRRGNAPQVLVSLRNAAIPLLRERKSPSLAAATRELAAHPEIALALLVVPTSIFE
jgi:Transposase DDE domain